MRRKQREALEANIGQTSANSTKPIAALGKYKAAPVAFVNCSTTAAENRAGAALPNRGFANSTAAQSLSGACENHATPLRGSSVTVDAAARHPSDMLMAGYFNAALANNMRGRSHTVFASNNATGNASSKGSRVSEPQAGQFLRLGGMFPATEALGQTNLGTFRPGPPLRQEFEAALMEIPVPWSYSKPVVGFSGYPPQRELKNSNGNVNANESTYSRRGEAQHPRATNW